jgi:hypothetical protein
MVSPSVIGEMLDNRYALRMVTHRTVKAADVVAYVRHFGQWRLSYDMFGYERAYYLQGSTLEVDERGEYLGDVVDGPLCGDCLWQECQDDPSRDDVYYLAFQFNGEIESGYEEFWERPRCINCNSLIVDRGDDDDVSSDSADLE